MKLNQKSKIILSRCKKGLTQQAVVIGERFFISALNRSFGPGKIRYANADAQYLRTTFAK